MTGDGMDRARAVEEASSSFVVEASAGTGKTDTLVRRILHLVLASGPGGGPLRMTDIAAITFTEKAAGEMRIRLRQEFEAAARRPEQADLAQAALRDLEAAAITTFHSFATGLLKERPFEANLDPRFATLDEAQSDLLAREFWEPWLERAIRERHPALEQALRAGMRLEAVGELSRTLRRHARAVRDLTLVGPPSSEALDRTAGELRREGAELAGLAVRSEDKLAIKLREALDWLETRVAERRPPKGGNAGAQANWTGGSGTVGRVRDFLGRVVGLCEALESLPLQEALDALLRWLRDGFLPEWEAAKRARGVLDFDDLLHEARDLLIRSRSARAAFQGRYRTLLVDEFQDTDAVQLDLVLLLSSSDLTTAQTARLEPDPGRLFIVGDPKQSIYRFRGADIETYLSVVGDARAGARGLRLLELTKNFRSVPSILRFVDRLFSESMKASEDGDYQPAYLPFGREAHRGIEPAPPAVHVLAQMDDAGKLAGCGGDFARLEALRVAALIGRMHDSADWPVKEAGAKCGGPDGWRPPRYGDIAVLLPVLTRVDLLEDALTAAGIPFVLEGGKFYYARSEVSSAITILTAIANPNDAVALYGSLRSIFFGLSDEDLLRARMGGQDFDYRSTPPDASALSRPFAILRELHRRRHVRSAAETFERLLQQTGAREVLAARGLQPLANLAKLTRTLRGLEGGRTYSQVVETLETMDEEGFAERESRLMEERSDAVRILSIHKAKGLDFRIAIVAGLGIKKRSRGEAILAEPHVRKSWAARATFAGRSVRSPGWDELSEDIKRREEAEAIRLLYVALTRACDHLVISAHARAGAPGSLNLSETRLAPLSGLLLDPNLGRSGLVRMLDGRELDRDAPRRPMETSERAEDPVLAYRRECSELARSLSRGLVAEGPGAAHEAEPDAPDPVRSRAARLGTALHHAMESADFGARGPAAGFLDLLAARHGLDREGRRQLEAMIATTLSSPLMDRVRAACARGHRVLRELPWIRPGAGPRAVEEGKIDLLFEEESGWILVDYKTDRVPADTATLAARHREQILGYRDALASRGISVRSAYLLFARTGDCVEIG